MASVIIDRTEQLAVMRRIHREVDARNLEAKKLEAEIRDFVSKGYFDDDIRNSLVSIIKEIRKSTPPG